MGWGGVWQWGSGGGRWRWREWGGNGQAKVDSGWWRVFGCGGLIEARIVRMKGGKGGEGGEGGAEGGSEVGHSWGSYRG